jgi:hypothetical protein
MTTREDTSAPSSQDLNFIFVCACPRSGTTFFADLLGSLPQVLALQKTDFKFKGADGITTKADVERYIARGDFTLANTDVLDTVDLPMDNADFYVAAVKRYAALHGADKQVKLVLDHHPHNATFAHVLHAAFPNAKFIHLVRDGRAVFSSVKHLSWGPATPLPAAQWWSHYISQGLALETAAGPARVLRVRYEDLVTTPELGFRRVCDFIGVDYVAGMTDGGGVKLSPYAADVHGNIGKPPLPARLEAWRKALPAAEARAFSQTNAALLHWLGYPVPLEDWNMTASRRTRMFWSIKEVFSRRIAKPLRQKMRRRATRVSFEKK